mgnify:CR=1 FL=1
MRHLYLYLALLLLPLSLLAQDYQLMVPGRTYLFAPRGNRAIHIDSVEAMPNGFRYHNYRTVKDCGNPSYRIGPRVMQVAVAYDSLAQDFCWRNLAGDSLHWPLRTQPGDRWRMTAYRDSLWLTVQHDSTTWDSVLGSPDSVRHYHVAIRDGQDSLRSDTLNGRYLALSQSHGFVQAFSYDDFPQDGQTFALEGVTAPDLGRQILTEWDFYDMPVGGEIHYEEVREWDGVMPEPGLVEFDHGIRWRILARQETPDMRLLTIDQTKAGQGSLVEYDDILDRFDWTEVYFYERDTITKAVTDTSIIRPLPYGPDREAWPYFSEFFRVNGSFDDYLGNGNYQDYLGIMNWVSQVPNALDTCWYGYTDSYAREYAVEGLGDLMYAWGGMVSWQYLAAVYYRFPSDSAGTPLDFEAMRQTWLTSVREPAQASFSLYPIPMQDRLYLRGDLPPGEPVVLRLYDLQGRHIWHSTPLGDGWRLPPLASGLYLAELWQGDRLLGRQKVRR